jgi:hypothetical protein
MRRRLAFRGVPEFLAPRYGARFNAPHALFNAGQYMGALASHDMNLFLRKVRKVRKVSTLRTVGVFSMVVVVMVSPP